MAVWTRPWLGRHYKQRPDPPAGQQDSGGCRLNDITWCGTTLTAVWTRPLGLVERLSPIGSSTDAGSSVTLDAQGRILVAGNATFGSIDSVVVRYNTNGTLDTTFGASSTLGGIASEGGSGSAR